MIEYAFLLVILATITIGAIYFLLQVIFLFVLAWFVERRRQKQSIDFPNRRVKR